MPRSNTGYRRRTVLKKSAAALAGTTLLAGSASADPELSVGGTYMVTDEVPEMGLAVFEEPNAINIQTWLHQYDTFVVDDIVVNDNGAYVADCSLGNDTGWIGAENDDLVQRIA